MMCTYIICTTSKSALCRMTTEWTSLKESVKWTYPYWGVWWPPPFIHQTNTELSRNIFLFTDVITDASVVTASQDVVEGGTPFTLSYSSMQGPVMSSTWYFKGSEVVNGSRYLITSKSLIINQPNRDDTGLYSVVLTNPFSNVTQSKNITVLCKWVLL